MFFNTIPLNLKNTYYKHCYLTHPEAKYVASQADIIIGIRSGLMDVITNKFSKIFCIYFPWLYRSRYFPTIEADKLQSCFSLKQLPNANPDNIYEYNVKDMTEDEILNDIISKISVIQKEKSNKEDN